MSDEIEQVIPPEDEEVGEQWQRLTDDPDLRGVDASRDEGGEWRIGIMAAEFIREEPLESEFRKGVDSALRSVSGVTNVWEEDRELWVAEGSPSGRDLVAAVAAYMDSIADRARGQVHGG